MGRTAKNLATSTTSNARGLSVLPPPDETMAARENATAAYWFAEQRAMREWMEANQGAVADIYEQSDMWETLQDEHEAALEKREIEARRDILEDVRITNLDMFAFVDNVKGDLKLDLPEEWHKTIDFHFPDTKDLFARFVDSLPEAE